MSEKLRCSGCQESFRTRGGYDYQIQRSVHGVKPESDASGFGFHVTIRSAISRPVFNAAAHSVTRAVGDRPPWNERHRRGPSMPGRDVGSNPGSPTTLYPYLHR